MARMPALACSGIAPGPRSCSTKGLTRAALNLPGKDPWKLAGLMVASGASTENAASASNPLHAAAAVELPLYPSSPDPVV